MKTKTVTVKVDESTHRWLEAFAEANCNTELTPRQIDASDLLAQAAFCIADYAGRRVGSWEADAGRQLMISSGFHETIGFDQAQRLAAWEEKKRQAWLKKNQFVQRKEEVI